MTASEMSLVPYFRQYIRQVLPLELFSDGELRRALTAVRPGWERDEAMLFSLAQDFYRDIELSNWDESKHPRGQPENAGEFAEKPLAKDSETTDNSRVGEKISVTLWRAADDDIVVGSASFSTDRDAAKAWLLVNRNSSSFQRVNGILRVQNFVTDSLFELRLFRLPFLFSLSRSLRLSFFYFAFAHSLRLGSCCSYHKRLDIPAIGIGNVSFSTAVSDPRNDFLASVMLDFG